MSAVLDTKCFVDRLQRFYTIESNDPTIPRLDQVDYIFCVGQDGQDYNDCFILNKQQAFLIWLLSKGDLPHLLMILGKNVVYFLCKEEQLSVLRSNINDEVLAKIKSIIGVDIEFIETNGNNESVFMKTIDEMEKSMKYGKIGILDPETDEAGNVEKLWHQCLNNSKFVKEDMSAYVSFLMSIKDQIEIDNIEHACRLSKEVHLEAVYIISNTIKMEKYRKKYVTNEDVAIEVTVDAYMGKCFVPSIYKPGTFDFWYEPVIRSGGNYDLSLDSGSDEDEIKFDVILMSFGIRHYQFCSSFTRPLIIMPTYDAQMMDNFRFLFRVQECLVNSLRDGVKLNKVYQDTIDFVARERSDLVDNLEDNFGSEIGIHGCEEFFEINSNNQTIARENMTFNITIGFNFIPDETKAIMKSPPHTYSLLIGDIVKVEKEKPATVLAPDRTGEEDLGILRIPVPVFDNNI